MKLDSFFSPKNQLRGPHLQHNTRRAKTFVAKSLSSFGQRRDQEKEKRCDERNGWSFHKNSLLFRKENYTHTHIQVGEHAIFSPRNVYGLGNLKKNGIVPGFFLCGVLRAEYLTILFSPATWGLVKKNPKEAKK